MSVENETDQAALAQVRAAERQLVAEQIHDGPLQNITACIILAERLAEQPDLHAVSEQIKMIETALREAADQVRTIIGPAE